MTDAPEPGAIQWLLLRVQGHEGLAILSAAANVRRTKTSSRMAPRTGCDDGRLSGKARMRYFLGESLVHCLSIGLTHWGIRNT